MLLLFLGVSVVESHDQFPPVSQLVVLIYQTGLGMTDVEVARGLGGKSNYDLSHLSHWHLCKLTNVSLLRLLLARSAE